MKALFQTRTSIFSVPGGDTVQILKTADGLRALGCEVDISTDLEPDLAGYDIVHLFNLTRPQELYMQAANARRQDRKIALSPIYASYDEFERQARGGIYGALARTLKPGHIAYAKVLARAILNRELNKGTLITLIKGYSALQREIVKMSDVLLPNSESEMRRIQWDIDLCGTKEYVVVPNAVDLKAFNDRPEAMPSSTEDFQDCILCVARIEGIKNQINLVRAMRGLPWKLLLIGRPAPNHMGYLERVKREAGPNVRFLGSVEHNDLPRYYRAAKVHALVSWMETTGLSSLEAGAMGCNLVITDRGDTREYFQDDAFYCEPGSVGSIREALIRAHGAPVRTGLRERIEEHYTWERAAERTFSAYRRVLEGIYEHDQRGDRPGADGDGKVPRQRAA